MLKIRISHCRIHLSSKNFLLLVIVLLPVLGSYSSGIRGVTLGDVFLLVAEILCIPCVLQMRRTKAIILYILMFSSMLYMTVISFGIQGNVSFVAVTRIVRMLFYALSVVFATSVIDYSKIKKIYMSVCFALILYIFIQFFLFISVDVLLTNKILPFDWYSSLRETNAELAELYRTYYYRGTGFFLEPSYAGLYLIPGFCITLYDEKDKRRIIKAGMFSCAVLITTSLAAILVMVACTFIYYFKFILSKLTVKKLFGIVVIFFIIVFALAIINRLPLGRTFNYRVSNLLTSRGGSTSMRLFRGFGVWKELETIYKVFGVGAGNLENYVRVYDIVTVYDSSVKTDIALDFANDLSMTVLYGGVFTFIIFISLILYFFKSMRGEMRLILCFSMFMFASAGGIFDATAVFYWSLLFAGYHFQRSNHRLKSMG